MPEGQPFYEHRVTLATMEPLNWSGPPAERIITAAVDDELAEYRLLAYLQRVDSHYRENKLYPDLDELRMRTAQLRQLANRADELCARMPREMVGLDLVRGEILRQPVAEPGAWDLVRRSLDRALPPLNAAMERGSELREALHGRIRFEPVGVVPLGVREGWLLLRERNMALVYSYVLPIVRELVPGEHHRRVSTKYYSTWCVSLSNTYEHIKAELVRKGPMPNPATFVFESDISLPRIETFLPLAKQMAYELVLGAAE